MAIWRRGVPSSPRGQRGLCRTSWPAPLCRPGSGGSASYASRQSRLANVRERRGPPERCQIAATLLSAGSRLPSANSPCSIVGPEIAEAGRLDARTAIASVQHIAGRKRFYAVGQIGGLIGCPLARYQRRTIKALLGGPYGSCLRITLTSQHPSMILIPGVRRNTR
jgi:hypothetical protein